MNDKLQIPVGVSNRHIHVTSEHLEILFGKGYNLTKYKDLTQKGQFAANEFVTLVTCKSSIENIRILGPVRKETQVELSLTDCFKLGIKAPIRESGNIDQTPGIVVVGPNGIINLEKGVIIAARHIHMSPDDAKRFNVQNNQIVSVKGEGIRELTFHNVIIRVREDFVLDFHIDTDEANAAFLKTGDHVCIV
ncbi:MAG TPA: phosphate propanoyltransferase [Caldisericia bacterium]|nr:phosphate propanoyltransferase [Caldisericia bacterium]